MAARERGDRDLEAERVVAGTLLAYPERGEELPGAIGADAFTLPGFDRLIAYLQRRGDDGGREPVDLAELNRALGPEVMPLLGGIHGVAELANRYQMPSGTVLARHVAHLERLAAIRRLATACAEIAEDARDPRDPETFVDRAAVKLGPLTEPTQRGRGVQLLRERTAGVMRRLLDGKAAGIPTGLDGYDRLTTGCGRAELIVIAGRPSMGKSVLGVELALGMGVLTYVAQLEMSEDQMITRLLCREGQVDMTKARAGWLTEREKADLATAASRVEARPMAIDDRVGLSIRQIRAEARAFFRKHRRMKLDGTPEDVCVVIDYGQLVEGDEDSHSRSREEEVGKVSRGSKHLARELGCPVLLLAQLNRKVDERPIPRPQLSDLRESGSLEQDADQVVFIWRPERYDRTDKPEHRGKAEIIVGKQRMGPIGAFWCGFDGKFSTIRNLQHHER